MTLEPLLIAVVVIVGLTPFVLAARRGQARGNAIGAVALLAVLVGIITWSIAARRPARGELTVTDRPIEVPKDGYVSSRTCRTCHVPEYDSWHASFHRTMTQVASPQSVVGRFDDVELSWRGRTYQLRRRDNEFWIEMDDPNWSGPPDKAPRVERRIVMTTGSHHLQTYWYETGQGRRLGQVPYYYSVLDDRWLPDDATYIHPPADPHIIMPVAGPGEWHKDCIKCHTTHGRPHFDLQRNTDPDARVSEMGIACEACHGPADAHVRANRDPLRRYGRHLGDDPDPTIVQPLDLDHRRASQVCGQCHSIFGIHLDNFDNYTANGFRYRPGHKLSDSRSICRGHFDLPTETKDGSFWSDGMVRVSGREFNGLIETPCYQRGEMSCLSCHTMHKPADDSRSLDDWRNDQLTDAMVGDQACLQCHESFANDIEAHTYHAPQSSGSRCYNCHMPYTTYGLHKAIRSHQVDSPSVAASVETGRPNACNQCHLDRTLAWTAEHLRDWYDIETAALNSDERTVAASVLWTLTGDAGQRALMAWSMGWETARNASKSDWMGPYLAQLLVDPYHAVRFIAYRSIRHHEGFDDFDYDFLETPTERSDTIRRAIAIWNKHAPEASRDAVLIDAEGRLDQETFDRLLSRRNNRRLSLNE